MYTEPEYCKEHIYIWFGKFVTGSTCLLGLHQLSPCDEHWSKESNIQRQHVSLSKAWYQTWLRSAIQVGDRSMHFAKKDICSLFQRVAKRFLVVLRW